MRRVPLHYDGLHSRIAGRLCQAKPVSSRNLFIGKAAAPTALAVRRFERHYFHFLRLAQGSEIRSGQFAECDGVDAGFDSGAAASATAAESATTTAAATGLGCGVTGVGYVAGAAATATATACTSA